MDKTEFLDQLRASLNGKMEAEEVTDNLRYYEEYINGQLRLGRTETEVMTSLGSPRLIARSIADAMKVKDRYVDMADSDDQQAWQWDSWRQKSRNAQEQEAGWQSGWQQSEQQRGFGGKTNLSWLAKFFTFPKWLRMTIGFAALAAFMIVFCWILKFLFPIIMLAMISLFLVKLFRDWLH
ncbi:MAG: DUF1700 domain-containing protein [Lachnospiraceae bacterium]|nr:DUF1700 domain-containing protein [Lachnospiraceae bacterium]